MTFDDWWRGKTGREPDPDEWLCRFARSAFDAGTISPPPPARVTELEFPAASFNGVLDPE